MGNNTGRMKSNRKSKQPPLVATLEYGPTEDAEDRLLRVFEFILDNEEINMKKSIDK